MSRIDRGVDLYTFGWALGPNLDFAPPPHDALAPPPNLYISDRRPRCRIWFLVFVPRQGRSFRAIEPNSRMNNPEKGQGNSVIPKKSPEIAVRNNVLVPPPHHFKNQHR